MEKIANWGILDSQSLQSLKEQIKDFEISGSLGICRRDDKFILNLFETVAIEDTMPAWKTVHWYGDNIKMGLDGRVWISDVF
jgi:hypothetical protein